MKRVLLIFLGILNCQANVPAFFKDLFEFICPNSFIQNGTSCLLKKTSTCPQLSSLDVSYSIFPKTSDDYLPFIHEANNSYCQYDIEEFLETASEENLVTMNLTFDNIRQPFNLYLDVSSSHSVRNIEQKILCVSERQGTDIHEIEITKLLENKDDNTLRFSLKMGKNLKRYLCCLLDAGRIKLVISNSVLASSMAVYIFETQVNKNCFNKLYTNDNYFTLLYNSTHYSIYGKSTILDIQQALDTFKSYLLGMCGTSISTVSNTKFCLPSTTESPKMIHWPLTSAGLNATSTEFCLNTDGEAVTRKCEAHTLGARWLSVKENCSGVTPSNETALLEDIQEETLRNVTDTSLLKISDVVTNSTNIKKHDVNTIAAILARASEAINVRSHEPFFKTLDTIQNVNPQVLSSSLPFGSLEKILNSAETFAERLAAEKMNVSVNLPNIAYSVQPVFEERASKKPAHLDVIVKDNKTEKVSVQVKLSEKFISSFNLSDNGKKDMTVVVIAYNTSKLFPTQNIDNKIVDITFYPRKVEFTRFNVPLSIFFNTNKTNDVKCVFWDTATEKWLKSNMTTISANETTVECQTYHLTRFSLLIIDERLEPKRYMVIWTIEAVFSFIGVSAILVKTIISKEWALDRPKTVHLSFIILIEITLLWIVDYSGMNYGAYCTCLGVALHYIVLVKFSLTLLTAKDLLDKFVHVFETVNKPKVLFSISEIFVVWVLPSFGITLACIQSLEKYNAGKSKFCYPKEQLFYFYLVLPVTVMLAANLITYLWILLSFIIKKPKNKKINSSSNSKSSLMFQFKLAIMSWFMLSIVWLLGVLSLLCQGRLQHILQHAYSFVAPLQGFALFVFSICLQTKRGVKRN